MADIPASVLDDPHVQNVRLRRWLLLADGPTVSRPPLTRPPPPQELRRILYKNVLSAEVAAMQRSGSAPASIDGMMQRQADVDYDQRSRFGSLGASPSETFLQEACFNNR
jgi:hypothetical protein